MSSDTKIGWADDSVNLWWGCVEVSPGCDNCYAREIAKRYGHEVWGVHAPRRILESAFKTMDGFQRRAVREGKRRRVFLNSMSDLAEILPATHPQRIEIDAIRQRFFARIYDWPDLDFIWLTKRIGNVPKIVPANWLGNDWPEHLWLVPSIVNQTEAERDIPKLLHIPAKVRGLSCEPLLGEILLPDYALGWSPAPGGMGEFKHRSPIHWIIVGGESAPNRRPMEPEWLTSLVAQCKSAGVACFVKQDSALREGKQGRIPDDVWAVKEYPALAPIPEEKRT